MGASGAREDNGMDGDAVRVVRAEEDVPSSLEIIYPCPVTG